MQQSENILCKIFHKDITIVATIMGINNCRMYFIKYYSTKNISLIKFKVKYFKAYVHDFLELFYLEYNIYL